MPIIANTSASSVRLVNQAMAATFFPRAAKLLSPKVMGQYTTRSEYEPFSILGAAPVLTQFISGVQSDDIASFTFQSPSLIFKSYEEVNRSALETDQTGTLAKRTAWAGVRLAQWQDQLFFTKLITGNRVSSVTETAPNGNAYTVTMDGLPYFSAVHAFGPSGQTQSNIINGGLPATVAGVIGQDSALTAQLLQRDMMAIQDRFSSYFDTVGSPINVDDDLASRIVLFVPPVLKAGADLAFRSPGAMIGGSPGNSGSTGSTTFQHQIIREVVSSPYLKQMINTMDGTTLTPTSPTEYYAFIVDDYVKPFYWQKFIPLINSMGMQTDSEVQRIMDAAAGAGYDIPSSSAALYATTEVDNNFGALGSQSQESTVAREKFFVSARARGNCSYGFPLVCIKIVPSGASS